MYSDNCLIIFFVAVIRLEFNRVGERSHQNTHGGVMLKKLFESTLRLFRALCLWAAVGMELYVAISLLFQIQPRLKDAVGVAGQLSCCSAHHTFSCLPRLTERLAVIISNANDYQ